MQEIDLYIYIYIYSAIDLQIFKTFERSEKRTKIY